MSKHKKRTVTVALVLAGALVLLAGGLMASNMGFKLDYPLFAAPAALGGLNTIALPYNREIGINTARDLFQDIGTNTQLIQRFIPASDTYQLYTFGLPDFPLENGVGYFVKIGATRVYTIVGTHNPARRIDLFPAGVGSLSGTNFFAPPYHATATTARDLFMDIGVARVQLIQRYLPAIGAFQIYTFGSPNFPLAPGEAVFVKMGTFVNYTPSHY